jgi:phosphoesterase RecJ-like protein
MVHKEDCLESEDLNHFVINFKKILIGVAESRKKILVAMHKLIDGDAIGAGVALALMMRQLGIESILACFPFVPSKLSFLPQQNNLEFHMTWMNTEGKIKEICQKMAESCVATIFLDCAESSQIPSEIRELAQEMPFKIGIDHHLGTVGEKFPDGTLDLVMETSSTCEILFYMAKAADLKITPEIAYALYIGIISDLRKNDIFPQNPDYPAEIMTELKAEMKKNGYTVKGLVKDLFGLAHWEKYLLRICFENKRSYKDVVYSTITNEIIQQAKEKTDSLDDPRGPFHEFYVKLRRRFKREKGFKVAMLYNKRTSRVTLNLLDRESAIDLSVISRRLGNGGGHRNRAGFDFDNAQTKISRDLGKEYLSEEDVLQEIAKLVNKSPFSKKG